MILLSELVCSCDNESLSKNGMSVIHIMIDKFSENELCELIALYKRACRILRKHSIEAGKKAFFDILKIKNIIARLKKNPNK